MIIIPGDFINFFIWRIVMKKMVAFCFVSALCVILTSCAGNYYSARHQTSNAVSAEATLAAETAEIWTRPLEIGFQVMGKPVEAFVESALDEDFSISSQTSLPNVFSNSPDGETKLLLSFHPW